MDWIEVLVLARLARVCLCMGRKERMQERDKNVLFILVTINTCEDVSTFPITTN